MLVPIKCRFFQLVSCNGVNIKEPEMCMETIKGIFSNISMHYKCQNRLIHDLAGYFGATLKFSLSRDFRDLLTSDDLNNIGIGQMIVVMHRALEYKHFKGYLIVL